MTSEPADWGDLDDLFAAARKAAPRPSDALMARVLDDALAAQPAPPLRVRPADETAATKPGPAGFRARLASGFAGAFGGLFGGGGVLAGLGTAAVAGLALGLAQPAPVLALTDALLPGAAIESVDLIPSLPGFLTGE